MSGNKINQHTTASVNTENGCFLYLQNIDNQYLCFCKTLSYFTGKERDEETGYGYFGARYMDHELMTMWLSVDPMSDKYPSLSPYAYCAWNPIKLVDPNGMDTIVSINIDNGDIKMHSDPIHNMGCMVQFNSNDSEKPIEEYVCSGYVYYYNRSKTSVVSFENDIDAKNVYNKLSGRCENPLFSGVEWNYYENSFDVPSQLITSQKRDEINVTDFIALAGLTKSVRHYQPYYTDLVYSLPSPQDIEYANMINIPVYLDYCGKSYRYDNIIPKDVKKIEIGVIRRFVNSKIKDYEGFCGKQ